jgi:Fe-S-cluster containining protein
MRLRRITAYRGDGDVSTQTDKQATALPWYAEGLRFGCQRCGHCCGGGPGYVWVDEDELADIAQFFGISPAEFRGMYVRNLWRGMSLREKANYDCVLLDEQGCCMAYDVRPMQCRNWPFWPSNLRSPEAWQEAAERCPGIGQGPVYAYEQIESLRIGMTDM